MTTAHRPTWAPAKGHEETGGARFIAPSERRMAKDLRSHTELKFRADGQASTAELAGRDLKLELAAREAEAARGRGGKAAPAASLLLAPPGRLAPRGPDPGLVPRPEDADDSDEGGGGGDSSEEDEDEDDTAALLAELEKIKAARKEEAERKEAAQRAVADAERASEVVGGNPLLHLQAGEEAEFGMKRSWHEDTVFKHQSRSEPPLKKRFINDTVRSDFHRRFLARYMK